MTYGDSNDQYYPNRGFKLTSWTATVRTDILVRLDLGEEKKWDERPYLKEYVSSVNNVYNCPLSPGYIDIEASNVERFGTAYNRYWSWSYKQGGVEQDKMLRIGDSWSYDGILYNLLSMDKFNQVDGVRAESSHPVKGSGMIADYINTGAWVKSGYKQSLDWMPGQYVDMNALYDDCSVRRFNKVKAGDARMKKVSTQHKGVVNKWSQVPDPEKN
jgi:hypothetical protein